MNKVIFRNSTKYSHRAINKARILGKEMSPACYGFHKLRDKYNANRMDLNSEKLYFRLLFKK